MNHKHRQFGPWTSSLHLNTRLELSAFWARRLHRLAGLAGKRHNVTRGGVVMLCALAAAMLAVPRLVLQPTAHAEQPVQPSVATSTAVAPSEVPFTATFSNGVKIQLIGLSMNPSANQPWWTPDGAKLTEPPYARTNAVMRSPMAREICWRWIDLPKDPEFEKRWDVPGKSGAGGGIATDRNGQEVPDITAHAINLPETDETCVAKFSVSTGASPWKVLFSGNGQRQNSMGGMIDGADFAAIFGMAIEEDGGTSIAITHQVPGMAVRLVAIERDGLPVVGSTKRAIGAGTFTQTTFHFANLSRDKIEKFDLQAQTRHIETIEFRNVSLHPDRYREVRTYRITPDGKEERLPVPGRSAALAEQFKNSPEAKASEGRNQRFQALLKILADEHGYRLKADQRFKHLPPPFADSRLEFWSMQGVSGVNMATGVTLRSTVEQSQTGFMVMQWVDGALRTRSSHFVAPTIQKILDEIFNLKRHRIEGDLAFLSKELPGDWVLGWDPLRAVSANSEQVYAATTQDIEAVEQIIEEELLEVVDLQLQEVQRPVYVIKGNYKFTPIAGPDGRLQELKNANVDGNFQIPARRTRIGRSIVSYQEFLERIGELLLVPILDETTIKPSKPQMVMVFNGTPPTDETKPFEPQTNEAILASLTAQTGFTFTKEERPVKMLIIKRGVRE